MKTKFAAPITDKAEGTISTGLGGRISSEEPLLFTINFLLSPFKEIPDRKSCFLLFFGLGALRLACWFIGLCALLHHGLGRAKRLRGRRDSWYDTSPLEHHAHIVENSVATRKAPSAKSTAKGAKQAATSPKAAAPKAKPKAPVRRKNVKAPSTPANPNGISTRVMADENDTKYVEVTPLSKAAFLAALASCGIVSTTCRALKLSAGMMYHERRVDPEFAKAWDLAIKHAFPVFEDEVRRRAFEGYERPVFQQGMRVGTVTEYSDKLAELMIRAGRPEEYNPRTVTQLEHSGAVGHLYAQLTDDELNTKLNAMVSFLTKKKGFNDIGAEVTADEALKPSDGDDAVDETELKKGS